MTRIAVTGATGFIGTHVVAELVRQKIDVVAIGRRPAVDHDASGRVERVQMELADAEGGIFDRLGRPDALIHLAWGGLPNYRSLRHFEQELPLQYRFLSAIVREGLPGLVVTGTCFEYGLQSGALDEAAAARPNNAYGFAKDALRRQLEFLAVDHPFAFTWGRLFYLHGEGQAANSLLPQLQSAVHRGDKVFNMSGGEQLRDYLPISEVARLLVLMALRKTNAGVLNICSGQPISVRKFVEDTICQRGWDIRLNLGFYPYPDYEPFAFWGRRERLDDVLRNAAADPP